MLNLSLAEVCTITGGSLAVGDPKRIVTGVCEPPRMPTDNDLYMVMNRVRDRRRLLKGLLRNPPAAVMLPAERSVPLSSLSSLNRAGVAVVIIDDKPLQAYEQIVAAYRSAFRIPVVQVVGSKGKTSTKEMIKAILGTKLKVLATHMTMNAPSVVARTLLNLDPSHQAAVIEAGMKSRGVIDRSSRMIQPTIGVITSLTRSHYTRLGSMENIARAKAEIIPHIPAEGILLVNGDDHYCRQLPVDRCKGRVLFFGLTPDSDIWASDLQVDDLKSSFTAHWGDRAIPCGLKTFASYHVRNALAAIAIGLELGIEPEAVSRSITDYEPVARRLNVYRRDDNVILIRDTYNADPDSVKMLLREIPVFAKDRQVILVIGSCVEKDEEARAYAEPAHYGIGEAAGALDLYRLITVGKWAQHCQAGAVAAGMNHDRTQHFDRAEDAQETLSLLTKPGVMVIFEGRQYANLDALVKNMK